jgi:hypothetical protein
MRLAFMLMAGLCAAGAAHAQMYKWVDENGRTQYTQTPPPPGRSAQEVKTPPAPPRSAQPAPGSAAAKGKDGKAAAPASSGMGNSHPDAGRMYGTWRSGSGDRAKAEDAVEGGGGDVLRITQQWAAGGGSLVGTGTSYVINGTKGAGTLQAQGGDNPAGFPVTMAYVLKDGMLILTVYSGPYEGQHFLTR